MEGPVSQQVLSPVLIVLSCGLATVSLHAEVPPKPPAATPAEATGSQAACHSASDPIGWIPAEVLQRPIPLRQGVGRVHEAVTTSKPEAQAFYDQGLAYLHSYVWIEAARSFHEALRHDPALAMAYVGLSRAYVLDPVAARRMLEKARGLAADASPRERVRIELRGKQLDAIEDRNPEKLAAYRQALDEALVAGWDDAELWLLRGNVEDPTMGAGGIGQRGGAASVPFYEHVLALAPSHFAADHYLVHSYEQVGRIDLALAHGVKYRDAAPEVPHAHHMYGHDLRRVGRTREAIAEFEKADALERAYFARENLASDLDWHHAHNLDLLAASYWHEGEMVRTEATLRRALAVDPHLEYREINRKEWPLFLLSRGRVEEAAAAARALSGSKHAGPRAIGHALQGEVALARNDRAEAEKQLALAQSAAPGGSGALAGLVGGAVSASLDKLRGQLLLGGARAEEGRALLKDVQSRFRARPGPDAWIQALYELEAIFRAAREAGDLDLAEHSARQLIEHDRAYAGSHFALALVQQQRGQTSEARASFAEAARLWTHADKDLPELKRALAAGTDERGTRTSGLPRP
jgi:tetratricopeptide (TPR) repeat protein